MTRSAEPSAKQTLILGCNRGFILKFEKEDPAAEWVKTGETRVEQVVSDLLQVAEDTVLAVQDEGCFDFIDVTSMESKANVPGLQGLSKSYKTALTQRLGVVAIGDANGLYFAQITHDANN